MRTIKKNKRLEVFFISLIIVLISVCLPIVAQNIRYVRPVAVGAADGSSWNNASSNLQAMININGVEEVWVASGTYKPHPSNREIFFSMKAGVKIYGGFPNDGTGTMINRNWNTNLTILSGDLNGNDTPLFNFSNYLDNSACVIYNNNNGLTIANSLLDGFIIKSGGAHTNSSLNEAHGGGMYNNNASPNIKNVSFIENYALAGGGMYNENNSSPNLINVSFIKNRSNNSAGGMWNSNNSSPILKNVYFLKNYASAYGGGLYNGYASGSASLTNVSFIENYAGYGAGMQNSNSSPQIVNCSFWGNLAGGEGGAIHNSSRARPVIKNTIFWRNKRYSGKFTATPTRGSDIYNDDYPTINASVVTLSNCILQLANDSTNYPNDFVFSNGNLFEQDPLFLDPFNGNIQLSHCSPAINAGNNDFNDSPVDLANNPRRYNDGTIDIGAYEYQGIPPNITNNVLYVNSIATGANNGSSWVNAFTNLPDAVATARICNNKYTEIWMASGTYKPSQTGDRNASFSMVYKVKIYGGFPNDGTGTMANRNWRAYPTILSGDLNGDDGANFSNNGDNSYHVVFNNDNYLTPTNSLLDGFIIKGGSANDGSAGLAYSLGGGMYNKNASPNLNNVDFIGNYALGYGGAIYNDEDTYPKLKNITFYGNYADRGGGIYNYWNSAPYITNSLFINNSARLGGGINNDYSSIPTISNVTFYGNRVSASGNIAYGGGVYNESVGTCSIKNCIFWGNSQNNSTSIKGADIYHYSGGYFTLDNSLLQLAKTATNYSGFNLGNYNIYAQNPLFIDAPNGNLQLNIFSPAINAGENGVYTATDTDFAGKLRIHNFTNGGVVDMGAYEYQSSVLSSIMSGNWEASATWKTGRVPQMGDNVIISQNHTVTINSNVNALKILYQNNGILKYNSSISKLNLGF